ncbi:MAG: GNAT family N-acetyltransferase [Micromonosporaceae bacterium]
MTQTARGVAIRSYRPSDHSACRRLWAELTEHRRGLFGDPAYGGRDPGAGFEEYLTQLNLSGMWVADDEDEGPIGFVGLKLDGREGEVDPVVVTAARRGRGVGRALLARVAEEGRRRGLTRLTVSPSVRDVSALHMLHAAGFDTLATLTLSLDVTGRAAGAAHGHLDVRDLRFAT